MAQEKYLTPREIFGRLKIFEKKMAMKKYEEYQPRYVFNELTDENLNKEVASMLLFAGILGYKSQCFWDTFPDDKGGDFSLVGNMNICIRVADRFKNNRPALLATLAHEVCHAVMFYHGIAQNDRDENEYCTDLCTIYMGFGRLIINGYNTCRDGVNHQLGYLKFDIYQQTYNLINIARNTGVPLIDCADNLFMKDTLTMWSATADKEAMLRQMVIDRERDMAYLLGGRKCLKEMVDKVLNQPVNQYRLEHLSGTYDECCSLENFTTQYPIHGLAALYECLLFDCDDEEFVQMKKVGLVLEKAVNNIYKLTPDLKHESIYITPECPHCGTPINNVEPNVEFVKCHKCHRNFYAGMQGYMVKSICDSALSEATRLRKEQDKKLEEAYERGRLKGIEANAATAYQRGYNEAKSQFEKRDAALPRWLRWLIARYH